MLKRLPDYPGTWLHKLQATAKSKAANHEGHEDHEESREERKDSRLTPSGRSFPHVRRKRVFRRQFFVSFVPFVVKAFTECAWV